MAVQKSRVTPARRGARNSQRALTSAAHSIDKESGELHRRHHISANGYYKGKLVVPPKNKAARNNDQDPAAGQES